MRYPTRQDRDHLADLVCSIRPEWQRWLVLSILQAHAHNIDLVDMTIAAVRTAADKTIDTPKAIGWRSRHWRDLDTAPAQVTKHRQRCSVCGKTEEACWTQRPGPDDHAFDPVDRDSPALAR